MSIHFSSEDWARIHETYDNWWNRTLSRPVIKATLQHPVFACSDMAPLLSQSTCHLLELPAEDIIDRIDLELQNQEFLGDAFPMVNFDCFGPGILAAFLGADLDNSTGNVWFHAKEYPKLAQMHFEFSKKNLWLNRIKEIYRAGLKKWQGNVLMGIPDLGGILDVLATLRGTGHLLMDLYDEPEEVRRISAELTELWLAYYRELQEILMPVNPGYSDWSGLYSSVPSYVVQCDFSYMISPEMFREFAAPDLKRLCRSLPRSLYHLDGKGELAHLPQLLEIEDLDAIQWCPGEGVPRCCEWPEVYQKIRESGKNIHILGNEKDFRSIADHIGSRGLYQNLGIRPFSQRREILRFLDEFQIPSAQTGMRD